VDGRASLLAATLAGERAFDSYRKRNNGIIADVVRDWPVTRIYQLVTLLDQFVSDFETQEFGPLPTRLRVPAAPTSEGPRP
jgi:hypothetical protein